MFAEESEILSSDQLTYLEKKDQLLGIQTPLQARNGL